MEKTVAAAFGSIELEAQQRKARKDLVRTEREMEQLHEIGIALDARCELCAGTNPDQSARDYRRGCGLNLSD